MDKGISVGKESVWRKQKHVFCTTNLNCFSVVFCLHVNSRSETRRAYKCGYFIYIYKYIKYIFTCGGERRPRRFKATNGRRRKLCSQFQANRPKSKDNWQWKKGSSRRVAGCSPSLANNWVPVPYWDANMAWSRYIKAHTILKPSRFFLNLR